MLAARAALGVVRGRAPPVRFLGEGLRPSKRVIRVEDGFHNAEFFNKERAVWGTRGRLKTCVRDLFGHVSFILLAISYLETDVLRLRCTAVASIGCSIVFQYFRPIPLPLPITWNFAYIALNTGMIANLLRERSAGNRLSAQERLMFETVFEPVGMTPAQFAKLLAIAHRVDTSMGTQLTKQGTTPRELMLIVSGLVEVVREHEEEDEEEHMALLNPGQFVAEITFLSRLTNDAGVGGGSSSSSSGGGEAPRVWRRPDGDDTDDQDDQQQDELLPTASATATCTAALRTYLYAWDCDELVRLLRSDPVLSAVVQSAMTKDVSRKLYAASEDHSPDVINRYYTLVEGALYDDELGPRERERLEQFRRKHTLSDDIHAWSLARQGWTVEDYERGHRLE